MQANDNFAIIALPFVVFLIAAEYRSLQILYNVSATGLGSDTFRTASQNSVGERREALLYVLNLTPASRSVQLRCHVSSQVEKQR